MTLSHHITIDEKGVCLLASTKQFVEGGLPSGPLRCYKGVPFVAANDTTNGAALGATLGATLGSRWACPRHWHLVQQAPFAFVDLIQKDLDLSYTPFMLLFACIVTQSIA